MSGGFGEYQTAAKMRDVIRSIVADELDRLRPADGYATVVTIDVPNRRCEVRFPEDGDTNSIWVGMGSIQPTAAGQVVRVTGPQGDRYIDDVMETPVPIEVDPLVYVAPLAAGPANVTGVADTVNRGDHIHAGGVPIVTVATRPASPILGEMIIESDTRRVLLWTGTQWRRGPSFTINARTGVYLQRLAALSVPNGGASTYFITFDTEAQDTDNFTSGGITITCPSAEISGFYLCTLYVEWASILSARAYIEIQHTFNAGASVIRHRFSTTGEDRGTLTVPIEIASGDTLVAGAWQNSGAAVNITVASLTAYRLFT